MLLFADKNDLNDIRTKFYNRKDDIENLFIVQLTQSRKMDISSSTALKELFQKIEPIIDNKLIWNFYEYLEIEEHVPIEVNFKHLKYPTLVTLFEEWWSSSAENSPCNMAFSEYVEPQSKPIYKFRNNLFEKLLVINSQEINDYMQTVNKSKKISDFDFFQLLRLIVNNYYLYEWDEDKQDFFQKFNSFDKLMQIIKKYKSGERKLKDNEDKKYIYKTEIAAILEFWESNNPQLTLQVQKRRNVNHSSSQTDQIDYFQSKDQNLKTIDQNVLSIINETISKITNLKTNILQSKETQIVIERVLRNLKHEKYKLEINAQFIKSVVEYKEHDLISLKMIEKIKKSEEDKLEKLLIQLYDHIKNDKINLNYNISKNISEPGTVDTKKINQFLQEFLHKGGDKFKKESLLQAQLNSIIKNIPPNNQNEISLTEFQVIMKQVISQISQVNYNSLTKFNNQKFTINYLKRHESNKKYSRYVNQSIDSIIGGNSRENLLDYFENNQKQIFTVRNNPLIPKLNLHRRLQKRRNYQKHSLQSIEITSTLQQFSKNLKISPRISHQKQKEQDAHISHIKLFKFLDKNVKKNKY